MVSPSLDLGLVSGAVESNVDLARTHLGIGFTAWYMDGRGGFQKDVYQGEGKKGRHPTASLRYMGSRLHVETGWRKVYAGEVSESQKNPMAAKETIGDGGGRKHTNSQFPNQNL